MGQIHHTLLLPALVLVASTATAQTLPTRPEPSAPPAAAAAATSWPSFRGPFARGVAEGYPTPQSWSLEKGEKVRWRTAIAGLAHSSPVVWGERIFVTTAVKEGEPAELKVGIYGNVVPVADQSPHEFQVLCLDRETGKVLWQKTAFHGVPKIKRHPKGSYAASSPTTDGKHVAAFFGSEGLHVYDVEGHLLWSKDFGVLDSGFFSMPEAQWGFGSSPVIHDGRLFVQCDVQKGSFVAAFEVATGKELWRKARDEVPTWCTPTVHIGGGRRQLILNGYHHMGGYDLDDGRELWKLSGGGDIPVPTPVVAHDLVFLTSAHGRMSPIVAIAIGAEGELSLETEDDPRMPWHQNRRGNYMQTPLVYRDELYCCNDLGVLTCFDARSGKSHYRERLGDGRTGFTSSGVAADGKLYFTSEEGEVHVLTAGPTFESLAVNPLGEICMATPAISRGTLYFRTRGHLVAIGE